MIESSIAVKNEVQENCLNGNLSLLQHCFNHLGSSDSTALHNILILGLVFYTPSAFLGSEGKSIKHIRLNSQSFYTNTKYLSLTHVTVIFKSAQTQLKITVTFFFFFENKDSWPSIFCKCSGLHQVFPVNAVHLKQATDS